LLVALKAASLARGAAGVRWNVVSGLAAKLSNGAAPALPADADAGRAALEALAIEAQAKAYPGSGDTRLEHAERHALLTGAAPSTALALAGLFEAQRVAQTALVAGALFGATTGAAGRVPPLRIQRLRRQTGASAAAATLSELLPPGTASSAPSADESLSLPEQARAVGFALDLLRQAGATLNDEANAVTEERFVLWQTEELIEAGPHRADGAVFASDMIALALARIGALSARRSAHLFESGLLDRRRRKKTPASAALSLRSTAATLAGEVRERGRPLALRPGAEEHPDAPLAFPAARRLLPLAGNVTLLLAIELMAAAEATEIARLDTGEPLQRVRDLLRSRTGAAGVATLAAPDLAAVADLVRTGAVAAACGVAMPSVVPVASRRECHLGGRSNRT
jgi:histidine ammonia-lyase